MKGKSKQWVLLVLVLLVWGIIVFRLLSGLETSEVALDPIKTKRTIIKTIDVEAYEFQLNYRDPFKNRSSQQKKPLPRTRENVGNSRFQKKEIPQVTYRGMVSGSEKRTAMILFNNRSIIVEEGQEIDGMRIEEIQKEKILIHFDKLDTVLVFQ